MYVLVADDDATLSDILRRELHGLGITAEIAATIADA
jgi:DNA-binding response OmpR family regulator